MDSRREAEVVEILQNWNTKNNKTRQDYYIHEKFFLLSLAGITKVMARKDSRQIATKNTVTTIIKDIHISAGHKGDRKTNKKYAKITLTFQEK